VLDASALLAYLKEEPGGDMVEELLAESSNMSAANWAEVLSKLAEEGDDISLTVESFEEEGLLGGNVIVHPLNESQARRVATLRLVVAREAGLSLADRACLALAYALDLPAYTADGAWRNVDAEVEIHLIR
jgi:PIN domain nuclease of toxin-antitoxin system